MNLLSVWFILSWVTASRSVFASVLNTRAAEILADNWLEWSTWTRCTESVYCLQGSRQRERQCQGGKRCVGIEEESEDCPTESCLGKHRVLLKMPVIFCCIILLPVILYTLTF